MRIERVEALIKHAISNILLQDISDPRIGFVTITRVDASKDLKIAKVYYSIFGSDEEKKQTKKGLESATSHMRKIIGAQLKLKFTPEIRFFIDDSPSKAFEIERLLDDITKGDKEE
ncbi:MAG: 30S ribosome-binding factor RbfA [Candidatus Omnitrophota bacterium]